MSWRKLMELFDALLWALVRGDKPIEPVIIKPVEVKTMPTNIERLHTEAVAHIGQDISKTQGIYGCAESVSFLINKIFSDFPSIISTIELKKKLDSDKRFKGTFDHVAYTIIISPTIGENVGHCGIFFDDNTIMSNSSFNSHWEKNYTLAQWIQRYRVEKHLHIYFYDII